MRWLSLGVGILMILASLAPRLRRDEWWIRIFDFPRLQVMLVSVVALATIVWPFESTDFLEMTVALGLVVAIGVQLWHVFPYTPVAPREVLAARELTPQSSVSLLVANVLMSNRDADRLLGLVAELAPDLVLALEPDAWWERALDRIDYPYVLSHPLDNRYGISLRSRLPLLAAEVRYLVSEDIPSIHAEIRLRDGRKISFYGLHPEPPSPTEAEDATERDAELLIVGRAVEDETLPVIVTGDLNDVAWSHTTSLFRRTSGLLDPRRGRGMFNTFHAWIPFLRFPLDHVFHSNDFLLGELRRLPRIGSDHFPILCSLTLDSRAPIVQDEPNPKAEDEREVRDKIAKVEPTE